MTESEPLQQLPGARVRWRGRALSYFSGCDYLRMAGHPRLAKALSSASKKYGLSVAASRVTTGNHILYVQLEASLERFFDADSALLVSTGYQTNLIAAQALAGEFSHVLLDKRAHPSLVDASRILDAPVISFRHRDAHDLQSQVKRCGPSTKLILLTDGMFSRDGSVAPLLEYSKVLPADACMLVDDSHGAGILGQKGRGTLEHTGIPRKRVIQTITLSKAFGAYGGAVLGTRALRRRILQRSQMFSGSTPLPLPLAAAALESVRLLASDQSPRERLAENLARIRAGLREAGFVVPNHPGPIVALQPTNARETDRLRRALLAAGIFPPLLLYPGAPARGYFRFVICSEHTPAQIRALLRVLTDCRLTG
jgi:8-amino-7-oxononanoate synthase